MNLKKIVTNAVVSLSAAGALTACGDQNPLAVQQDINKIREVVKQELSAQGEKTTDENVQKVIVEVRAEQCAVPGKTIQGEGCGLSYGTAPEGCSVYVAPEGCRFSYAKPEGCTMAYGFTPEGCHFYYQ